MPNQTGNAEPIWKLEVDGVGLVITRTPTRRWEVVYGGFSKPASKRLVDAIAVAAGAHPREPWIVEIARGVAQPAQMSPSTTCSNGQRVDQSARERTRISPLNGHGAIVDR
jgi:hypothetical protein